MQSRGSFAARWAFENTFSRWLAHAAQHTSSASFVATRRPAWQSVRPCFASMHVDILYAPRHAQKSRLGRRALRSSRRAAQRMQRAALSARPRRRSLLARHACVVALTLPVNVSVNLSLAVFAVDAAVLLPWLKQYNLVSADQRSRRRVQRVSMVGGGHKKISHVCTVEVSGNHIWMAVFEEGRESEAETSYVRHTPTQTVGGQGKGRGKRAEQGSDGIILSSFDL